MVTSIQISESLRDTLLEYKNSSKVSYEDIINKLLSNYKKSEKKKLLIQGYKDMANLTLKMNKEWEKIDFEDLKKIDY